VHLCVGNAGKKMISALTLKNENINPYLKNEVLKHKMIGCKQF
jgi:hypothetical protein